MLRWTVEAALAAGTLARVVVSTDDDGDRRGRRAARCSGDRAELAADETPMLDVVLHALAELGPVDAVCLLQPTSPLRRAEHVDGAVRLFEETGPTGSSASSGTARILAGLADARSTDGRLVALDAAAPTRRQDKPALYARNGPAVLVVRVRGARRARPLRGRTATVRDGAGGLGRRRRPARPRRLQGAARPPRGVVRGW